MANNFRNFMDMSIAIEEDDILNDGMSADGEIEVDELVTAEEDVEEIAELRSEIDTANDVVDESVTVAEELEQQVEVNEEIIEEQPEAVTDDMVVAAQEHFFLKLGQLHFDLDYVKSKRVSMEEAVAPVTKLRLSTEGIKETLGVIWDKIKQFFARIGAAIKKFISKITLYFKTGTKKIEKLISLYKMLKKSNIDIDKDLNDNLFDTCGVIKGVLATKAGKSIDAIQKSYMTQISNLDTLISSGIPEVELPKINKSITGMEIFLAILKQFVAPVKEEATLAIVTYNKKNIYSEYIRINENEIKFEKEIETPSKEDIADISSISVSDIIKDLTTAKKLYTSFEAYTNKCNILREKAYKAASKCYDSIKAWDASSEDEKSKIKKQRSEMLLYNRIGNTYAFRLLNDVATEINLVIAGYNLLSKHADL